MWASKITLAAFAGVALVAGAGTVTAVKWVRSDQPAARIDRGARPTPAVAIPRAPLEPRPVTTPARGTLATVPAAADSPPTPPRLPRESTLIDQARTALARGDLVTAQRAIDRHARQFASGLFEQEREALAVLTLARGGQVTEAQERAEAFHRRFPASAFRDLIAEALRPAAPGPPGPAGDDPQ